MAKIDKINVAGTLYDINLPTDANITISSALINVVSATQDGFEVRGNDGDSTITIQPTSDTHSFDGSSYIRFDNAVNGCQGYILQDANSETFKVYSNCTNGILLNTASATQPITFKQGSSTMKVPTTEGTHTLATMDDLPLYENTVYISNLGASGVIVYQWQIYVTLISSDNLSIPQETMSFADFYDNILISKYSIGWQKSIDSLVALGRLEQSSGVGAVFNMTFTGQREVTLYVADKQNMYSISNFFSQSTCYIKTRKIK